jgi:FkbH-like protein
MRVPDLSGESRVTMKNIKTSRRLDGSRLTALVNNMTPEAGLELVGPTIGNLYDFDADFVRDALLKWEDVGAAFEPHLAAWLEKDSPWRGSLSGRWLLAELWSRRGRNAEALEMWDALAESDAVPREEAVLSRARLRRQAGDITGALQDLRMAARLGEDYAFLARIARLLDRLWPQAADAGFRQVRIALLYSTTTELLAPLLRLACFRDGLTADIYQAPYGNYRQEILDPESGLYRFKPDVVIIGVHWRDAHLPAFTADRVAEISRVIDELSGLWRVMLSRHDCTILQHGFDLPVFEPGGHLSSNNPGGRIEILRALNGRLREVRSPGVTVVDLDRISAEIGLNDWESPALWHVAKQHPAANALPLLVDHYLALIRACIGMAKKVLVLDLDNTLWGGVIGEDGIGGIKIGSPSPEGEAHAEFQRYVLELKRRGVLLAVCSKNNEEDGRIPFRMHDGMVLKEDDFAAFFANWRDKAENLRSIAKALNVGLDSFVFFDDSAFERQLVRQTLPEVTIVESGLEPACFVQRLHRGLYFENLTLSKEDSGRHAAYLANIRRDELRGKADDPNDFLRRLDMTMHHGDFGDATLERVTQLIGKTNQFNLTTRRHSISQVELFMHDHGCWTHWFRLEDRFGDNGIIGIIVARQARDIADTWEIDTFLMSCRAIGRRVEEFMLATLLAAADKAGFSRVRGVYIPTAKNGLVADLFPRLGFRPDREYRGQGSGYVWDLRSQPVPSIQFFRDASCPDHIATSGTRTVTQGVSCD